MITAGESDEIVVIEFPLASISAIVGGGFSLENAAAILVLEVELLSFGYWFGSLMTSS